MLAEVISRIFKINFSRANDTKGNETFTALDAIAEACQKIENFQDALQFSGLSRLRTQSQNIAYAVDYMLKNTVTIQKERSKIRSDLVKAIIKLVSNS